MPHPRIQRRQLPRARVVQRARPAAAIAACLVLLVSTAQAQTPAAAPQPKPQVEAGLGKGVVLRSPDDRASLNIRARVQVRSSVVASPDDAREETSEMAIRRMRLLLQGNAAGPALTYYIQLSFANLGAPGAGPGPIVLLTRQSIAV